MGRAGFDTGDTRAAATASRSSSRSPGDHEAGRLAAVRQDGRQGSRPQERHADELESAVIDHGMREDLDDMSDAGPGPAARAPRVGRVDSFTTTSRFSRSACSARKTRAKAPRARARGAAGRDRSRRPPPAKTLLHRPARSSHPLREEEHADGPRKVVPAPRDARESGQGRPHGPAGDRPSFGQTILPVDHLDRKPGRQRSQKSEERLGARRSHHDSSDR